MWDGVRKWTGAGAQRGAGTRGGYWARDGAGAAAGAAAATFPEDLHEILRKVPVLLRGFRATAEGEDPA